MADVSGKRTTWQQLQSSIIKILTFGLIIPDDIELRGKIIVFHIMLLIGVLLLFPLGILRLYQGSSDVGFANLSVATILLLLWFFRLITRSYIYFHIASITIIVFFIGYLAISTGHETTGLLWSYMLPGICLFLFDRKYGSIILTLYLIAVIVCFLVPFFPSFYNYTHATKLTFTISFIVIWIMAYYFESIMFAIQWDVSQKNIRLERALVELEETKDQLFHAQKMEAIGRLAGGVAHDFNNILGGIAGYADLLRTQYASSDPKVEKYATTILNASFRASDLTSKLLAYARKGKYQVVVVDMHKVVTDTIDICQHTMPKNIVLKHRLNASVATVMGDRNQLQNALINLAVNAQDAMPEGGELTVETAIVDITGDTTGTPEELPCAGRFLEITMTDTGNGMDPVTLSNAFEPFYTTKSECKGTGLGLSSVYGTIKSHNGYIRLKSELNQGTTVEMYLPSVEVPVKHADNAPATVSNGKGTIVFIDDEEIVRIMAGEMLKTLGYTTVLFKNGKETLEYYKRNFKKIDLVIIDMVMPQMGGLDCFMALKEINPHCRALAISGYDANDEIKKMLKHGVKGFLQKPFDITAFSQAVRESLAA